LPIAAKPLAIRLAANAVGLLVLDARGVAFDPDAEGDTKVKGFFVG
jgi:hypothetical protein